MVTVTVIIITKKFINNYDNNDKSYYENEILAT